MAFRGKARGGPSGNAVLRQVRAELEKGWKPGLTVLTGDDLYHLDAAQKAILAHLAPGEPAGFGLTVLADGKIDPADLVSAARSLPMFAARRVVFVRDVGILAGEPDALTEYAKNPPAASFLVVRAPKLDLRRPLHKALAAAGTRLEFASAPPGPESVEEIRAMAKERGFALDRQVAAFLLEAAGPDLLRVASELDKIGAWLGAGARAPGEVTLEIARAVGAGGGLLEGWEVADAVLARDSRAAHEALRRLVASGEEPLRILGGLAWRIRGLLQAKGLTAGGTSAEQAGQAVRVFRRDFPQQLARFSAAELLTFPSKLLNADRALKSRALDPRSVLESLLSELIPPPAEVA